MAMPIIKTTFRLGLGAALLTVATGAWSADWTEHVPLGWKLIADVAEGPNAVLMIEEDNPENRFKNDGLGPDMLNTNPRKLIFLSKAGSRYKHLGSADNFLPSEGSVDTPCLADPLEEGGVSLKKGVLTISMNYWLSCGSYGVTKTSYKFRLEGKRYRLIGLDSLDFSRSSGMGRETSINYLTARKLEKLDVQVIDADDGTKAPEQKTIRSRIGQQRYYLDSMDPRNCKGGNCQQSWCLNS